METLFTVFSYAIAFSIGVWAGIDYTKRDMEDYREYLEGKRNDLMAYRDQLLDISESLEKKDAHIRKKWQSMVTDFSKYQSALTDDSGKWTDMDDMYLDSWKSAEK